MNYRRRNEVALVSISGGRVDQPLVMKRSPLLRYGVAALAVGLAVLLKLLLEPVIVQETPFLLVFGAVMISAWYGGLGPGLVATVAAALVADYFFLPPVGFSGLSMEAVPVGVFVLEGVLVSLLATALRSARYRAEASALEAESHQEDLSRSEEHFRLLVNGVKDYAIFMLDPGGRVVSWNAGAENIKGYKAEEIIGVHFSAFYTEEDIERDHPEEELRVAATEGRYEEEGWRVRKDGSQFWASVLITALRDEEGNLRGFAKVTRDITDRKQAEERLRQSLDALLALYEAGQILGSTLDRKEIGVRLLEIIQRVSYLSAAVINLRDDRERLHLWHAIGPEDLWRWARGEPNAQAACHAVIETGEHELFELRRPSPEATHLVGLCVPLRARDQTIGVVEAYGAEDLAERETVETIASLASQAASALENSRLYEELVARERQLHDLVSRMLVAQEEERRRVAYDVHDGLTQTAVAAYQHLQVFAEDHPPSSAQGQEELDEAVGLIQRTVREARDIIADLRPTVLDDFGLTAAMGLEVEKLRNGDHEVSYEETLGDERLPITVETALFRFAQEALTNVRKHARAARVRVTLQRLGQGIRLEVRDWGPGFQSTGPTSRDGPGERVGLSSMKERVALLGGHFEVDSNPGAGTSIVAEVPLPETEEGSGHEE